MKTNNFLIYQIKQILRLRRVWWFSATARTKARFARTKLGSYWLGLSNLLSVGLLVFLYGTIFIFDPADNNNHSRNVCVFANGEVDRSPTGTGVSARAAIHYARNEIKIREMLTIESIIGSTFNVSVIEESKIGSLDAVIPEVVGSANIVGRNTFWVDPTDDIAQGFMLR